MASDDTAKLYNIYNDALKEVQVKNLNSISKYFPTIISASEAGKAIFSYIKYIVFLGNPISHVESLIVRDFCKFNTNFSHHLSSECLHGLVKLVE